MATSTPNATVTGAPTFVVTQVSVSSATPTAAVTVTEPPLEPTAIPFEQVTATLIATQLPQTSPTSVSTPAAETCVTSDNKPNQLSADTAMFSQYKVYASVVSLARKALGKNKFSGVLVAAKNYYTKSWTMIWQLPESTESCPNTQAVCNADIYATQSNAMTASSLALKKNSASLLQTVARSSMGKTKLFKNRIAALKKEIDRAYVGSQKYQSALVKNVSGC